MILDFLDFNPMDTIQLLFFLIPGFIFIKIYDRIAAYSRKLTIFEWSIYSITLSTIIYLISEKIFLTFDDGINFLDLYFIKLSTFLDLYFIMLTISLGSIILSGIVVKKMFRANETNIGAWQAFAQSHVKNAVVIMTITNHRFYGRLKNATIDFDNNQDIILHEPELLKKDGSTISMGTQIFFPKESVRYIIATEEPFTNS